MRRRLVGICLALAGCGGPGDPSSGPSPTVTASPAAPHRQIGQVSRLSGSTSPLRGDVTGFQVERTSTETRVELAADTLFAFDEATLTPTAEADLARTAELVRAGGDGVTRITGYTDAKGDDGYNLALSRRRADAVAGWLRARPDLAGRRFEAAGRGKADPVAPNTGPTGADDPAGRARNRRVVVAIPR